VGGEISSANSDEGQAKKRRRTGGRTIVLQGQEAGEPQHCMMGAYELMEGKLVSGKGVWQRKGSGLEAYLNYAGSSGDWWVGRSQANIYGGGDGQWVHLRD
jgi:hypothetical protein